MRSVNPATGEVIREYKAHTPAEVVAIVEAGEAAFRGWSRSRPGDRGRALRRVAGMLEDGVDEYASLITTEMGKRIEESRAEIRKCAWLTRYVAEEGPEALSLHHVETEAAESYVRFDPLGLVLAVMPWNFPFWQVFRAAVPAIMAGNGVLLKHASNVSGCALAIEELFVEAGLPEHLLQVLLIDRSRVDELLQRPEIRGVTVTGSEEAGSEIASRAGREIKKSVLELGGSDPFIVFDDADIDHAVQAGVSSRMINSGQSCICAKRFLVAEEVFNTFVESFTEKFTRLRVGHPLDMETQVAPLARDDLLDNLHRQVAESRAKGATLHCGGEQYNSNGFYYRPTVLTGVTPDMPVFNEETFGPVAPIVPFSDEDEAVRLANSSEYGLAASVWTANPDRARRMAERLEVGTVFVDELVKSDPRLPFGGIKRSGYGRELSHFGLYEFTNIKSVWISG